MRGFSLVLIVSLSFPIAALSAQELDLVTRGSRVRLTYGCSANPVYGRAGRTDCTEAEAIVAGVTRDSVALRLVDPAGDITLPFDSVERLAVQRGRKSNIGQGALFGFLIGALGGGVIGATQGEGHMVSAEGAVAAFGLGIGAAGAVAGAIVGAFVKSDRWEEVPLDRLRVSLAPQRDGVSFGFRIAF